MNFLELKSAITAFSNYSFSEEDLNRFVYLAQQKIIKESTSPLLMTTYVKGIDANNTVFQIPGNTQFRKIIDIFVQENKSSTAGQWIDNLGGIALQKRTLGFIMRYNYEFYIANLSGFPSFYGIYNINTIEIAPHYTGEDNCIMKLQTIEFEELSLTKLDNNLTLYSPDTLLNAAMCQAFLELKDLNQLQIWVKKYQDSLMALNGLKTTSIPDKSSQVDF